MAAGLRVGIDLVAIQDVAASIAEFGDRYLARIFTNNEIAYCQSSSGDLAATLQQDQGGNRLDAKSRRQCLAE